MKALTLSQPYATLVAIGAKRIETRSWRTAYRGRLAIHAAKAIPRWAREEYEQDPVFKDVLSKAGFTTLETLPTGGIVAFCYLVGVEPIRRKHGLVDPNSYQATANDGRSITFDVTRQELAFGGYSDGRFAWLLDDVTELRKVFYINGAQRLWNFE